LGKHRAAERLFQRIDELVLLLDGDVEPFILISEALHVEKLCSPVHEYPFALRPMT
jgi:hypothetical protein